MGQQYSQADDSVRSIAVTSQKEKVRSARSRKSFNPTTNVPLLSRFCCNVERRQVWKDTTIQQLKALGSAYKWAAPLADFLQETNTDRQDEIYMADMYSKIIEDIEITEIHDTPKSERSQRTIQTFQQDSVSFTGTNPDISLERLQFHPISRYEPGRRSSDHNIKTVYGSIEFKNNSRSNSIQGVRKRTFEYQNKKGIYLSPLAMIKSKGSLGDKDISPKDTTIKKSEVTRKAETTADNIRPHITLNETPFILDQSWKEEENYKQGKKKYKGVIKLLQRHLSERKNIFHQMINKFSDFMEVEYLELIQNLKMKETSIPEIQNLAKIISHDTEIFIQKLYKSIDLFYQLKHRLTSQEDKGYHLFFSRDNITTALLSSVFNEKLYTIHYQIYKLRYSKLEKSYKDAYNLIKGGEPQDFGVPEYLALNNKTIGHFIQQGLLQPPRTLHFTETICSADFTKRDELPPREDSIGSPMMRTFGRLHKQSDIYMVEDDFKGRISELEEFRPYDKVIKKLRTIVSFKSASHKMKVLMDSYEEIENSIKEFYQRQNQSFEEKLSESQILPIFLYIIAKSEISDLCVHLKFIRKFLPREIIESKTGFYISVIEASISCICNTELEDSYNFKNLDPDHQDFFKKSIKRLSSMKQQPNTFDNISETA